MLFRSYVIVDPTGCDDYFKYEVILTVTDDAGLSSSDTADIFPACPSPKAGFTVSQNNICASVPVLFIDTSFYAAQWFWEFTGGVPATSNDQSPTVTYNNSGTYAVKLKVKNPYNIADSVVKTNYITILSKPQLNLTVNVPDSICPQQNVLFNSNASGYNNIKWYKNNALITNQNSPTLSTTGTGQYMVLATSANGCTAAQTKQLVAKVPKATLITSALPHCYGDSVLLRVAEGNFYDSFIWKKSSTNLNVNNDSIYVKKDGVYFVTASNVAGCTAKSVKDTVDFLPNITVTASGPLTFCKGDSVVFTAQPYPGQTYQWRRNTVNIAGATSNQYVAKSGGNYTVYVGNGTCYTSSGINKVVINCRNDSIENFEFNISIDPNPVHVNCDIQFFLSESNELSYLIYDLTGNIVYQSKTKQFKPGENFWTIDTKFLKPGVYILNLKDNFRLSGFTRLIKTTN